MKNNNRGFASDNNAGIVSEYLKAIETANSGHVVGYGDDIYTHKARETFKEHFGVDAEVFFVLTGTGANVLGLSSLTQSFHGIICAETAHINVDECGAPEKFTNSKLLHIAAPDGKLTPELILTKLHGFGFEHHVQPRVISISQPTELGTVYTKEEILAISGLAKKFNLYLHMDGARLANAAVYLNLPFEDFTRNAGVDVLSFGGTKNGMLFGESVVFFNPLLAKEFKYLRKQGMQLVSKMRFISAQFEVYLKTGLWKKTALHANRMARLLEQKLSVIPQIRITQKVQSNAVFAIVPPEIIKPLQRTYFFYTWDEQRNEVRWMTSFDTTEDDIESFVACIQTLLLPIVSE